MIIISWNVNGIRAVAKKGLHESLESMNADIVCLQETKATAEQVKEVMFGSEYTVYANEAEKKGYSGTAILSRTEANAVSYGIGIEEHDKEGRVITAEYDDFYVVNVYVPNSKSDLSRLDYRKQWDLDLQEYLAGLESKKPVVFCGDMNVAHREIDLARPKPNYNKSAGFTQTEIDGMDNYTEKGLTDSYRALHPDDVKYSWWSYRAGARAKNIGWRIDYVLVSASIAEKLSHAFILNEVMGSDHCPVGVEF